VWHPVYRTSGNVSGVNNNGDHELGEDGGEAVGRHLPRELAGWKYKGQAMHMAQPREQARPATVCPRKE
jgi:hypothetical protein